MHMNLPADDPHIRPAGADDETVAGVGKLTEALEKVERARGALYDLHQLVGGADAQAEEAAAKPERAGKHDQAAMIRQKIVGRNVLPGRWTFQIIEEFDEEYYLPFREAEKTVRDQLLEGRKHVYESEMKERLRTPDEPGHEARP